MSRGFGSAPRVVGWLVALLVLAVLAACGSGSGNNASTTAATESVLHFFAGGASDGQSPGPELVRDGSGNLYGTTFGGGPNNAGMIFKIGSTGKYSVVRFFAGGASDGAGPSGLVLDSAGNLYGATQNGGSNNVGTVFKIDSTGTYRVLHAFAGGSSDGAGPGGLVFDSAGNLYGLTANGGLGPTSLPPGAPPGAVPGYGTVFRIDPAANYSVVHFFAGGSSDGVGPVGLAVDGAGNVYGATSDGGPTNGGIVFKIDATASYSVVHFFAGGTSDGAEPSDLVFDSAGNLYGSTILGGPNENGTIFKIDTAGSYSVAHFFAGGETDGAMPYTLIADTAGGLYGATYVGGLYGLGVIFKIGPTGSYGVVHVFAGGSSDGGAPFGRLTLDSAGNLYGVTGSGGSNNVGTVFRIDKTGTESILHFFVGGTNDGSDPTGGPVLDGAGHFCGTTFLGGAKGFGTVYRIC